jgi:hypothetical protein
MRITWVVRSKSYRWLLGSCDGACRTTMLPYSPSSFWRPVWTWYVDILLPCRQFIYNHGYHIYIYIYTVTCRGCAWLIRRGVDWIFGFIDTLYTPLGTLVNYSAIAISTLYSSLLHSLVSSVFTSRTMAKDF